MEAGRARHYDDVALDVFRHFGECVGEALICDRLLRPAKNDMRHLEQISETAYRHLDISGAEFIQGIVESGTASIGLSGHVGSFELLAYYLVRSGLRMSIVGRKPDSPVLARLLEETRRGCGVNMIWRHDPNAARQIVAAVRDKQVIAILIDQDMATKNCFAPFFGLSAASPAPPLRLAVSYKLPVFTCFINRTQRMRYSIATEPILYSPEDTEACEHILEQYNARLEQNIRRYPEQWVWWHRRWRRRPGIDYNANPALLPSTADYLAWLSGSARDETMCGCCQNQGVQALPSEDGIACCS